MKPFKKGKKVRIYLQGNWYDAKIYSYNAIKHEYEVIQGKASFNIEEKYVTV